jgi:hypothetical protein
VGRAKADFARAAECLLLASVSEHADALGHLHHAAYALLVAKSMFSSAIERHVARAPACSWAAAADELFLDR